MSIIPGKANVSKGFIRLLTAGAVIMAGITAVDRGATVYLAQHEWPVLSDIMGRTLFEGELPGANDILVIVLTAALIVYLRPLGARAERWSSWRPQAGFILLSTFVIAFLFTHCLKLSLGRARPDLVLNHGMPFTAWFSFGPHFLGEGLYRGAFPSGHTAQTFSLMSVAYALAADPTNNKNRFLAGIIWGLLVMVLSLTMAVARCMSLSHWLSDVIGSIVFGWLILHLVFYNFLRIPDQARHTATFGRPPDMPFLWELRICLYLLLAAAGTILFINGLRAIFLGYGFLFAIVFVPALFFIYFGARKTKVMLRYLDTALSNAMPHPPDIE